MPVSEGFPAFAAFVPLPGNEFGVVFPDVLPSEKLDCSIIDLGLVLCFATIVF
jgi:hypothetical protein